MSKIRYLLLGGLGLAAISALMLSMDGRPLTAQEAPKVAAATPEKTQPTYDKDIAPFLKKYACLDCHSDAKLKGKFSLEKYKSDDSIQNDRKVWDNVVHMVQAGEMPPEERPQPTAAEKDAVLKSINFVMANIDCGNGKNVGRVTLNRLNRFQYNNTIRDLIGVDFKPAADFPNDDVGYGFANIGDVLSMSPVLLERYLNAAESILDKAIVIVDAPKATTVRLSNLKGQGLPLKDASKNVGAGSFTLSLSKEGSIFGQSLFEEGDYIIRAVVGADQAGDGPVKATLWLGEKISKTFDVKTNKATPVTLEWKTRVPKNGTYNVYINFDNPLTEPAAKVDPPKVEETKKPKVEADKTDDAAKGDDVAKQGEKEPAPEVTPPAPPKQRVLYFKYMEVDGPYDPPPPPLPEVTKKLLAHSPGLAPRDAAKEIVTRFATKAYRRPVSDEEVERILALYDKAEKDGDRFENRIRASFYRILVSPHFLFRVELDPADAKAGTSYRINDFNLASRLSYFLWSTMPDDELFTLAQKGELRQNLESQVKRMLADPKSNAFIEDFVGQWLTIRNLAYVAPDPKIFPNFDEELRDSMYRETELFFNALVREDHSIFDIFDADFTFVNARLAKHYGIAGAKGKDFQRVKTPTGRFGVLTQGSILTITSNPDRTSPVKRGKWVLDQLLNTPPPPPPPDVPELASQKELKGSLRKQMEMHRENVLCASCHARMDPIGFAFENYDAIGARREKDGDYDIDPSGVMPGGQAFKGPSELIEILKSKKDLFARALTEKMLTYAMGRGVESYDKCAIDPILAKMEQNDYHFSTMLVEIVKSDPFQMRTASGSKK